MGETLILTGTQAAALAAKLCRVQVIAAYPITPQSKIPEVLSEYVERGELEAEFVRVESEHTAMGVCISASIVGARVFTATASNGLAYMHEQLHWAAGARLPIVMPVANRGLGAPWTILNDMQDTIAQRDTGWLQFYCMNNQEVLDMVILAYKVAEQLMIPTMVCFDGFRLSHTVMPVSVPGREAIDAYLPAYKCPYTLSPENPVNINPVVLTDPLPGPDGELCPSYMGFRHRLQGSFENALSVIAEAGGAFGDSFGRSYGDPLYRYRADDADILFVTMGSLASEASETADLLREEGIRAGVVGLRVFRPFPSEALSKALAGKRGIAVVEKAISYGYEGALATELKAALYCCDGHRPTVFNYITGLGGKDVKPTDLLQAARELLQGIETGAAQKHPTWIGAGI
ncbi:MAG: pyruvate ferredoxin oxidoreductase [Desulfobacteraceae bacterium]|nr:pyruvate ferredoxin oxidoreductase [Desulfobacteraceae bacterium]